MKNVFVFFLTVFVLLAGPGRAQVKVLFLRDTTNYQISRASLDKKYTLLTELFRAKPQGAFTAMQTHRKRFDEFMKKRPDVPTKGFMLMIHEYYQPNGSVQFVLIDSDRSLPDSVAAQVVTVMTAFYQGATYPAAGTVPFRTMAFLGYGKAFAPARTVRRGAGIISTLAAAQKTTQPDTVKMLALNQLDLKTIPDVVYRFPNLEEMDLSKNLLNELPARLTADIPTLKRLSLLYNAIPDDSVFFVPNKHLVALNLQGNKLTRVPPSVRHNRRLESLWLGNNDLAELDMKPLRRLRRLNDLNLYNAGLTTLPKSVGRLKRLTVLDLYYNKFRQLPQQVGRMKRLEQLAVAYNDLTELPASLAKLRRLQKLYAHHNRISQLPNKFRQLQNLRVLDLSYNWFAVPAPVMTTLPALEELDLSNNNIGELPTALGNLKSLKKLYLRSNPLTAKDAKAGPYAPVINQLEANQTEVFY